MKLTLMLSLLVVVIVSCDDTSSKSNVNYKPNIFIPANNIGGSPPLLFGQTHPDELKRWSSKVGDNYLLWDGKELHLKLASGSTKKIFLEFAKNGFKQQVNDDPETKDCLTTFYFRPLAITGNLISFESEWGILCGAINTSSWSYAIIEVAEDKNFLFYRRDAGDPKLKFVGDVYLSDMFSEPDIFNGLLSNDKISKDISKLIEQGKIDKRPTDLAELKELVTRFKYDFLGGRFYLDSDAFENFTMHHLDDNKISVWISLTPSSPAAQGVREHLEIFLPIPEEISQAIKLADAQEEGFLMKNREKLVGTNYARFEFGRK